MFWRRLLRIAIGGVVCALLVLATGWLVRRVALGVDDVGMRMRVEAEVRSAFDRMARRLRTMAVQTSDLSTIRAALDGDTSAVRRLLTSTAAVVSEDAPFDPALTIYSDEAEPLAWAGRPSDLPPDRLQGEEAWFVSPSASGLRLMYVRPVMDNGARVATLAVERPVTLGLDATGRRVGGLQGQDTDAFRFPTWIAEVSMQLRYEGEPTADDWADAAGTINYEIVTRLGARIPRRYVDSAEFLPRPTAPVER